MSIQTFFMAQRRDTNMFQKQHNEIFSWWKKSKENFMIMNAIYIAEKTRNAWTITLYCKGIVLLFQKIIPYKKYSSMAPCWININATYLIFDVR